MNPFRYSLGLFLAAAAFGAQSATSLPTGGLTVTINAGTVAAPVSTSFALPLYDPPFAVGAGVGRIASLTATTLTCTAAGWTTGALSTAAAPYACRITSGNAAGATFYVTSNTADTLTTSNVDLSSLGIATGAAGDTFRLVPVDTLKSLFGPELGHEPTLQGATGPTEADIVYVGSNSQSAYYFNTALWRWVRTTGPTTDRGNIPIPLDSGILITRKSAALTLRFTGRVPDVRFSLTVANSGTTYAHTGFPTDVTLGALSLQTALPGWTSGATAATADVLTVGLTAAASSYFYNGTNWQRTTGPATNRDTIVISAGTPIMIFKRGVAAGTSSFTRALPYAL